MARKSKIVNKKTIDRRFSIEGLLNLNNLPDGAILIEVEEEPELFDIKTILQEYVDCNIKLTISNKTEEVFE